MDVIRERGGELPATGNYAPTASALTAIKRVRYWHEYVLDLMLTHPEMSQGEMATLLGRSESWLSRVVNSDQFQLLKAMRRGALNERLDAGIKDKVEALADITLDLMVERVTTRGNEMTMQQLRETCDMALKASGYGTKSPQVGSAPMQGAVQVNVHVTRDSLEEARARMRRVAELEAADGITIAYQPGQLPAPAGVQAGDASAVAADGKIRATLDWSATVIESSEDGGNSL